MPASRSYWVRRGAVGAPGGFGGSHSVPSSFCASHVFSEWKAGAGSGGSAAGREAAWLSQQGGATQAAQIHGGRGRTAGGQTAPGGERPPASRAWTRVGSLLTPERFLADWEPNGVEKVFRGRHRLQQEAVEREGGPDGSVHDGEPLWSV